MRKIINRVLGVLGLKIIRAKRKADTATLLHSAVMRALLPSLKKVDMGPMPNDGKTHFVGDGCWPTHQEFEPPTSNKK